MNLFQLLLLISTFLLSIATSFPFQDVSTSVGLLRPFGPRLKYGGAVVADLDGDGWPDLSIAHHDQFRADIYFNLGNGSFTRAKWNFWHDSHGLAPFHETPRSKQMSVFASVGGNYGKDPSVPILFRLRKDKTFSQKPMTGFPSGRGRQVLPMTLTWRPSYWPHFIVFNAVPNDRSLPQNFAGSFYSQRLNYRNLKGFTNTHNNFGTVTDVDMDSRMELISFHILKVHKVVNYFTLRDISVSVLPKNLDYRGVVSVSEFDFDNDGLMDLYLARSATNDVKWLKGIIGTNANDHLLRNVGGRYVDVSVKSKINRAGESRGVTAGDFNNDGYIDLLVTQYTGQDRLLLNNGDGTFKTVNPGYYKNPNTRGDQPVAVDYNRDGRLDVILSEGHFFDRSHGGYMRVMKNNGNAGNWILVRVGSSPTLKVSSLHALVTVQAGSLKMIRRVGSPGSTTANSYIELVHFGLGKWSGNVKVSVKWTDFYVQRMENVRIKQVVSIGVM